MDNIDEDSIRERLAKLHVGAPAQAENPKPSPKRTWLIAPACLMLGAAIGVAGTLASTPDAKLSQSDMRWLTLQFAKAQDITPNAAKQFLEAGLDISTE